MKTSITCLVVLVAAMPAPARILNVPADYPTIQAGIDASVNGDTVLVAPGSYAAGFTIDAKNILLSSSSGPDATVVRAPCSIQGEVDSTCIIEGFMLRNDNGGGISVLNMGPDVSSKIEGNIFYDNSSAAGGAIGCWGANPIIRSNIIRHNFASFIGGGICFENSSPPYTTHAEISSNIIYSNTASASYASGHGGGIYLSGGVIIKYNLIFANAAHAAFVSGGTGGGIYLAGSSYGHTTAFINNTIVHNSALFEGLPSEGGGLYITYMSPLDSLIVENNIFAFNRQGGNIKANLNDSMYCRWDYNLIYGDTTSAFPHGEHDIFLDPLLVDTLNNDFHLLPNSPCIDAGDPDMPLDPDSTRADIGAYYFDQSVGIDEDGTPSGPHQFSLKQNYPNPFNGQTIISYYLDKESTVSLFIFSITGNLVLPLVNREIQDAGAHKYIWEGRDANGKAVSTGIYFYELYVNDPATSTAGKHRESKAMILIK